MSPTLSAKLHRRLADWDAAGYRRQRLARAGTTVHPTLDDRSLVNFASNDYLGLAADARVMEACHRGIDTYGIGAGASELVSGHTEAHAALEAELAQFTGRERALVFSTGYMANLSVIGVLAERGSVVLEDRLNHASLLDAAVLARARLLRYAHADANAVAQRLRGLAHEDVLVVTDGVFSMDGDIAPLRELAATCARSRALLICDDAHGFGVLGHQGAGVLDECGLGPDAVPVLIGTFGKALGAFGAFVAGSEPLVEALIQFARPYIYTTALPPAIAVAVRESLRIVRTDAALRGRLHHCINYFRTRAGARGLPLELSTTPIQPLILGASERVMDIAARLRTQGVLVGAIRPPSVPAGSSRLRITLSAAHREEQIDALVDRLACLV